jgi:hypothetical protein
MNNQPTIDETSIFSGTKEEIQSGAEWPTNNKTSSNEIYQSFRPKIDVEK